MFASVHRTRGLRLIRAAAGAVRVSGWTIDRTDPDGLRHVATMLVRIHWFFAATCLVQLVCRPAWGAATYAAYALLFLALVAFTGCPHYRLASGRPITWRWIFAQSAVDRAVVSGAAAVGGGFGHHGIHRLYDPALADCTGFVTSVRRNLTVEAAVAVDSRPSPPPRGAGPMAVQPQCAGIQSDGSACCLQ